MTYKIQNMESLFGLGKENKDYQQYFEGKSYLNPLNSKEISVVNVTFEPETINHWHVHHGSGQILLVTNGKGYYQEWGKPAIELHPGDVVYIAPEIKHWHGASKNTSFAHLSLSVPNATNSTEWLEPVKEEDYASLD